MRIPGGRALVSAALLATGGCSFIAIRRPPPPPVPRDAPLECTESRTAPVLDTVGAVLTPLVGVGVWGLCSYVWAMQGWSSNPVHMRCGTILWGTGIATVGYAGSAVYGFHATAGCRRLAEQLRSGATGPWSPTELRSLASSRPGTDGDSAAGPREREGR